MEFWIDWWRHLLLEIQNSKLTRDGADFNEKTVDSRKFTMDGVDFYVKLSISRKIDKNPIKCEKIIRKIHKNLKIPGKFQTNQKSTSNLLPKLSTNFSIPFTSIIKPLTQNFDIYIQHNCFIMPRLCSQIKKISIIPVHSSLCSFFHHVFQQIYRLIKFQSKEINQQLRREGFFWS